MDDRAIGVFDSGLGGLTVVKELSKIMANEDIVYFGDTGRVPYGTRGDDTIRKYCASDIRFLESMNVKMIVAACGTASAVFDEKKHGVSLPYVSVLEPTAEAAARATKNGRIGVTGTAATINSGAYKRELLRRNRDFLVDEKPCGLFVPLVENGFFDKDNSIVKAVVREYLAPFAGSGIDTMILGCTHYPLLKEAVRDFLGEGVTLIDSGEETARHVKKLAADMGLLSGRTDEGAKRYFVSDSADGFWKNAKIFLGEQTAETVEYVSIDEIE